MLSATETLIQQFLKTEGLPNSAIGYRPETMIAVLKNDGDFSDFRRQIDFEKNPHTYIDRRDSPQDFKEKIDDRFPHIPGVKNYSNCMIRKNPTVDTTKLCE